jgi:hypothetical protein
MGLHRPALTAGWITFFEFFVWLLVLVYLVTGLVHKTRAATTAMLAASGVLLMDTGALSDIPSVCAFLMRVRCRHQSAAVGTY